MPTLPTSSSSGNSIQIGTSTGGLLSDDSDEAAFAALGGKWEDEEERRFFEDIQDLREVVPKSILGIEESTEAIKEANESDSDAKKNAEDEEVKRLREELEGLEASGGALQANGKADTHDSASEDEDDEYVVSLSIRTRDQLMFRDIVLLPRHLLLRRRAHGQARQQLLRKVHRNCSRPCLLVFRIARIAPSSTKLP
jgi:hypothetical protein